MIIKTYNINSVLKNTFLKNYTIDANFKKINYKIDVILKNLLSNKIYMVDSSIGQSIALFSIINIINFEVYSGVPSWHIIDSKDLVFSSSTLNTAISPTVFQGGTHLGTDGTDKCGVTHIPNVKIISANQMSVNGGGTVSISDANLVGGGVGTVASGDFRYSTFRVHFHSDKLVSVQNGKLYIYNTESTVEPAENVDIAAYVVGNDQIAWKTINSFSTIGNNMANIQFTDDDIGGNINGYISLLDRGPAMDHYFNVVISASPESTGNKNLAIGIYLEYF